jgi:hypothetical protein
MKPDRNSVVNQEIKGRLVAREVFCNANALVEFSIRKSLEGDNDAPIQWDDIENLYQYPEYIGKYASFYRGTEEKRDAEIERLESLLEELEATDEDTFITRYDFLEHADKVKEIEGEIQALRDLESEQAEIYEWWAVSGWFAEKLKEKGECVITGYSNYWGRCTTGQAILLDRVISEIAEEMEILEGQAHSWAKA